MRLKTILNIVMLKHYYYYFKKILKCINKKKCKNAHSLLLTAKHSAVNLNNLFPKSSFLLAPADQKDYYDCSNILVVIKMNVFFSLQKAELTKTNNYALRFETGLVLLNDCHTLTFPASATSMFISCSWM